MRLLHKFCFAILLGFASPTFASELYLAVGLMSGTSMDGIDASLLETDGLHHIREVKSASLTYTPSFHMALKTAEELARRLSGDITQLETSEFTNTEKLSQELDEPVTFKAITKHSTRLHCKLVQKLLADAQCPAENARIIGYHGQTLLHIPKVLSLQVGDGQLLADMTGIPVINDFRTQDILAGGQGAPFAPLYHQALAVRETIFPCAFVNNGGIANITFIFGPNPEDLVGFDTGPGNRLIDLYVKQKTNHTELMDKDGQHGLRGKVHADILKALYEKSAQKGGQNYYDMPPPKSLDSGDLQLIADIENLSFEDGCATLEAFTAYTIYKSLNLIKNRPTVIYWFLAGGGWKNPVITNSLRYYLGEVIVVKTVDEMGWNNQSLEAQIFAWMAVRSLKKLPLSVPQTTGVPKPTCGGIRYDPNVISKFSQTSATLTDN